MAEATKHDNKIRMILDEKDYELLVNGGTVMVDRGGIFVEMILSDIGFDLMMRILVQAMAAREHARHLSDK